MKFFFKQMLKYDLCCSLYMGQESSNRWRFAVPIFREAFDYPHVEVEQSAVFNVKSLILSWLGLSSISLVDRQKTRVIAHWLKL